MLHTDSFFYLASVVLQLAAVMFCGLMVRRSVVRVPWMVMSGALTAMLAFRVVSLLAAGPSPVLRFSSESYLHFAACSSAVISLLLFISLFSIRRLSVDQQAAEAAQRAARADAERRSLELEAVIDNMPDAVYIGTAEGITRSNRRALEMLGFQDSGTLKRSVESLAETIETRFADTGQRVPRGEEVFERALAGESNVREVIARNLLTGRDVIIRSAAAPIVVAGKVVGAVAVNSDITESKRIELELRDARRRLEAALSAGEIATWVWDIQNDRVYADANLARLFSVSTANANGGPLDRYTRAVHPDDLPGVSAEIAAAVSTGRNYEVEYRVVLPDGSHRWVIARGRVERDAKGVATSMPGVVLDVTERVKAEQGRRELLSRFEHQSRVFETVLSSITDFAYIFDSSGRFLYSNPPLLDLLGIKLEEIVGKNFHDLYYPPELATKLQRQIQQVIDTRAPLTDETPYASASGVAGVYEYIFSPVFSADGRIDVVAGSTRDITRRKASEAEREQLLASERQARADAERASEAKNEFLATLSHELRTPLTPVLLTLSLMESHPGLPADLREDVASIKRNVELESRLISDLLDLTRIARGKLQLESELADAHLLIRSAIDICQREDSVHLTVDLSAERHHVLGDGTRLQQVWWNLINNAIRHGGPGVEVILKTFNTPDGRLRVVLSDNGQGIDAAVLPKLFTAFEQGEVRSKIQFAGLGLGLAICRKLVEAHGGTITASSEGRGHGATFIVELPTVEVVMPVRELNRSKPAPGALRSLRVLLVEDNEPTLVVMTKLLERVGHRVTAAPTMAGALVAARGDSFDVLLSDLGLPDGSGLELMRELRDQFAGRAIALTGFGMEDDIRRSHEAGFTAHLTKPIDLDTLNSALRKVVGDAEAPSDNAG